MTQSSSPNLGEQALDKLVEMGISSQLDEAEAIQVDIRANPLQVIQGEVEAMEIAGKGLVMQQDLRVETMEVRTGTIAFNPLSTLLGKVELTQPAQAEAHLVLTEADLNRALESDYLRGKIKALPLNADGQPLTIEPLHALISLPGNNQLIVDAELKVRETGEIKRLCVSSSPCLKDGGQRISLENISFAQGEGFSIEFATALLEQLMELLDLRNFELEGIAFRLQKLYAETGRLIFHAVAVVEQFPEISD